MGAVEEILARIQAVSDQVSDERLAELVRAEATKLICSAFDIENLDGLRQVERRLAGTDLQTDEPLVGGKYARWGLTVSDIEFLYDLQRSLMGQPRIGGGVYAGPSEMLENAFKAVSQAVYLPMDEVRAMDRRALDDAYPRIPLSWFHGADRALAARGDVYSTAAYQEAVKAMDSAESGYGSQLIGAQYVRDLWEGARTASRVFGLIDSFEMTDPTAYLPVEADLPELLFVSENTASNSSNYTTSKSGSNRVTVTAKKFVIHQMWSGEPEEDSLIPFIPFLRRQAELSIAHYSDSLVLNGDTTNVSRV